MIKLRVGNENVANNTHFIARQIRHTGSGIDTKIFIDQGRGRCHIPANTSTATQHSYLRAFHPFSFVFFGVLRC